MFTSFIHVRTVQRRGYKRVTSSSPFYMGTFKYDISLLCYLLRKLLCIWIFRYLSDIILHTTYKPPSIELEKKSPTLIQKKLKRKSRREEGEEEEILEFQVFHKFILEIITFTTSNRLISNYRSSFQNIICELLCSYTCAELLDILIIKRCDNGGKKFRQNACMMWCMYQRYVPM